MTYDADWLRANTDRLRAEDAAALDAFNACHRLTRDEQDELMTWTARVRPELTRYPVTRQETTWPLPTSMTTPTRLRVSTRPTAAHARTTSTGRSSGASSCRRSTSASRSSGGRSAARSGSGWADAASIAVIVFILAAWLWIARGMGGV